MALLMTAGPAVEPVTLAEAKAHLRVDGDAEDALISSLIMTSRLQIEAALSMTLITQSWSYFIDRLPADGVIRLPLRPVLSLDAVRFHHDDGGITSLPTATFALDGLSNPSRLIRHDATSHAAVPRLANAYEFAMTLGFGPSATDVPAPIRQAILQLVSHWFEHRDPSAIGSAAARIPSAVSQLLAPWQSPRLC